MHFSADGGHVFTVCGGAVKVVSIEGGVVEHSVEEVNSLSCILNILSIILKVTFVGG